MYQLKFLAKISLFLCFALVAFGCASSVIHTSNEDFGITAEAVPEGILIIFRNIPPDANHMWIGISRDDTDDAESHYGIISSYAAIEGSSSRTWVNSSQNIDKIKQTGRVIFPFVEAGINYLVTVTVYNEHERKLFNESTEDFLPRSAHAEVIAENGIFFNRDNIRIELNDNNSAVTLSSEPVFSSELFFDRQKYSFAVFVFIDDNRSISAGDHHFPGGLSSDGLTWVFEPQWTNSLIRHHLDWLDINSDYSAWADARAIIIYDDIKWSVEIAKTPEFRFSL